MACGAFNGLKMAKIDEYLSCSGKRFNRRRRLVHQSGSLSSEFEYPTLLVVQCRYFRGIGLYTHPILTDCLSFNRHSYGELYVQV
jgi:hypothetical protein